jgi:hypothetical protein
MNPSQIEEIDRALVISDQNRRAINKIRKLVAGLRAVARREREILTSHRTYSIRATSTMSPYPDSRRAV